LLFARSIILVEGTSEAVLLPVFAKYSTFSFPSEKTWVRQFLGVTIVAVGSVDFSPYITLLLKKNAEGNRLADNLIILTDGDPDLDSEDEDIDTSIANRADTLDALATSLDAAANLKVFSSQFTLEADFLLDSGNHSVLQTIFNKQHPRSSQQWSDIISDTSPAQFFYRKLRKNRKYLKKGEFAHDLAKQIEDGESFTCPTYIKDAIKAAVNYSSESQDAQPPVHS
jgi:putative ATP-dependent endonuclease of OLD family